MEKGGLGVQLEIGNGGDLPYLFVCKAKLVLKDCFPVDQ